ncbi:MAG: branched-chain amino acid transporter permease [Frankiales bacterium]|nr:branched-chain amino acid transporter permease [Frankiales bacterium]
MDLGVLLQALVGGLATGAVLGLVALGFTLVAGTVRVLHLAHGDVVVAAVFTGVLVVLGRTPVATTLAPGPAVGFALLVLAAGAVLSGAAGWLAVRPHLADVTRGRATDVVGWVAALVAAGLLLREVLGLLLPQEAYAVPDPLRLDALSGSGVFALPGGGSLPARVPAVLVLAVVVGVAAERLLVRSRFGRALRAVADDPDAAALCGVPARRVVLLAFVFAGLLAGIAGLLDAPGRALSVDDGVVLGLAGIAAALLGGLGSLRGALAGGLVVGVAQSLAVTQLGAEYSDVVPLGLLVALLCLRPEGLRR